MLHLDKAIVNGRPPALALQYTDCKFPEDQNSAMKTEGETELSCEILATNLPNYI